jgi:effector-binding domain-containing protein
VRIKKIPKEPLKLTRETSKINDTDDTGLLYEPSATYLSSNNSKKMSKNPLQLYRETSKTGDIDDTDPLLLYIPAEIEKKINKNAGKSVSVE